MPPSGKKRQPESGIDTDRIQRRYRSGRRFWRFAGHHRGVGGSLLSACPGGSYARHTAQRRCAAPNAQPREFQHGSPIPAVPHTRSVRNLT